MNTAVGCQVIKFFNRALIAVLTDIFL